MRALAIELVGILVADMVPLISSIPSPPPEMVLLDMCMPSVKERCGALSKSLLAGSVLGKDVPRHCITQMLRD